MTNDYNVSAVTRLPQQAITELTLTPRPQDLLAGLADDGWDTESLAYSLGKTQGYIDYLIRQGTPPARKGLHPDEGDARWITRHPYQETRQKNQQKLPEAVSQAFTDMLDEDTRAAYIAALQGQGWTLQAIADAAGLSRERVRQIAATADENSVSLEGLPLPEQPVVDAKPLTVYEEPSPETLRRLLELKEPASKARGIGSTYWNEGLEFSNLIRHAVEVEGVSPNRLAKRLGMGHTALRLRAIRYGHRPAPAGDSRLYAPIKGL